MWWPWFNAALQFSAAVLQPRNVSSILRTRTQKINKTAPRTNIKFKHLCFRPTSVISIIFRQLPSELIERNSTETSNPPNVRKWVQFENACPKFEALPPLKIASNCHIFRRFRNLRANLTANIFGTKQDNRKRRRKLQRAHTKSLKFRELWSTNGLK